MCIKNSDCTDVGLESVVHMLIFTCKTSTDELYNIQIPAEISHSGGTHLFAGFTVGSITLVYISVYPHLSVN